MADGYGFGAEGDWKTCALVRAMKVMAAGLEGGTSFMEDYTYHLGPDRQLVLGAHMLEICESIAHGTPSLEIHPLAIGGREDPVRLVFNAPAGPAVNASMVDLGNRFRLLVNEVDVVAPPSPLPRLPVARAVWTCRPDFKTRAGRGYAPAGRTTPGSAMPSRRSTSRTSPRSPASSSRSSTATRPSAVSAAAAEQRDLLPPRPRLGRL